MTRRGPMCGTWARYRNPEVDQLLDEAGTEADSQKADAALAKAQALIWHDAPYIWLQINENVTRCASR